MSFKKIIIKTKKVGHDPVEGRYVLPDDRPDEIFQEEGSQLDYLCAVREKAKQSTQDDLEKMALAR